MGVVNILCQQQGLPGNQKHQYYQEEYEAMSEKLYPGQGITGHGGKEHLY